MAIVIFRFCATVVDIQEIGLIVCAAQWLIFGQLFGLFVKHSGRKYGNGHLLFWSTVAHIHLLTVAWVV
jgi:hypothetical protein